MHASNASRFFKIDIHNLLANSDSVWICRHNPSAFSDTALNIHEVLAADRRDPPLARIVKLALIEA